MLLTDLLLPIAPALTGPLVICCSSGWKELAESGPRRRRGLPPFGPPLLPIDKLPKPLIRPSSRNGPSWEPEAVGVSVGVTEAPLPGPYSWKREIFDCKLGGKLAVDGTGDGVKVRRSATDLAARRFC